MAALSAEFGDDLAILAFPTGEFGGQELPTDEAIRDFAYGRVNFPQPPRGILYKLCGNQAVVGTTSRPWRGTPEI